MKIFSSLSARTQGALCLYVLSEGSSANLLQHHAFGKSKFYNSSILSGKTNWQLTIGKYENMVSIAVLTKIPIAMICFSYLAYCIFHGGFHLKHRGWITKQENPRLFYLAVVIIFLVGLITLVTTLIDLR